IRAVLARRRHGHGRGARVEFGQDEVRLLGGARHGRTMGGPGAGDVGNTEWPKWQPVMSRDPVGPSLREAAARTGEPRELAPNDPRARPGPGHADLVGMTKYALDDARPVLERASARETATRVALGAVAAAVLEQVAGVRLVSHVVAVGPVEVPDDAPAP